LPHLPGYYSNRNWLPASGFHVVGGHYCRHRWGEKWCTARELDARWGDLLAVVGLDVKTSLEACLLHQESWSAAVQEVMFRTLSSRYPSAARSAPSFRQWPRSPPRSSAATSLAGAWPWRWWRS